MTQSSTQAVTFPTLPLTPLSEIPLDNFSMIDGLKILSHQIQDYSTIPSLPNTTVFLQI